jgi:DnaJ family protein A protein 2
MSELYGLLGVGKKATADEIKRAYRKEALAKHPDRGGNKEEFQAMQGAYDVLSDPGKRAQYDATGQIPMDGPADMGHGGMPDLSAIFGSMFGGGGMPFFGHHFGPQHGPGVKVARGPNKLHEIGVGLSDLYKGKTFRLTMKREVLCGGCDGEGGSRMEACGACGGKGFRIRGQQMGPIMTMMHEPCGACSQSGKCIVEKCGSCEGRQVVESESVLDVVIEPGMQEGDRLTFEGKCSESPLFERPGDVVLVLRAATTDSEIWKRKGADLTIDVELTLAESLLGWERQIEGHPSGRPLHIVWTNGVLREGEILRIGGWGMPKAGGGLGDLRIVCRVKATQGTWSEEQLRALKSVWADWSAPVMKEDTVMPCVDA